MKQKPAQVSCIILAGGEGRRVGGADKGLVSYNNKPLIETVIKRMKSQADDIIISANRNIETYTEYADCVISDSSENYQGPLAGINACLPHCKHSHVIVVACDMPKLPANLVSRLNSAIDSKDIAIATVDGHHQLALLLNTELSGSIQQRLDQGNRTLIQWVESVAFTTVNFDDNPEAFINLNHLPDQTE